MATSSPKEPGGSLFSPEAALIIAVILASAGAISAIGLVVVTGLRGGSPSDAILPAVIILAAALLLAWGVMAYGKRVARRRRPAWMAATTEWRQEIVKRQEEYIAHHTPVPPTGGEPKN